ncbi:MAG: LON peptidase substrate-binding domain-containing protein [Myxococcota bacterium]
MNDPDSSDTIDVIERLPTFPLPTTVLFPGTVLPLHIFEPRYRQMVEDALEEDGLMAVALVRPGFDLSGAPPIHDVAGCGRIIHSEKLDDGRYNILVQGIERVQLVEEVSGDRLYREFRARVIPRPNDEMLRAAEGELAKLQSCVLSLRTLIGEQDAPLIEVLRSTSDPLELADILAASLISDSELQQQVLAARDVSKRLSTLIDVLAEVMLQVGSSQTTERSELN